MDENKAFALELAGHVAEAIEEVMSGKIDGCIFKPTDELNSVTIEITTNRPDRDRMN